MLREIEQQIVKIRQNLKTAQDMQKIYVDLKRSHKEFKVGGCVYLRVNPMKSCLKLRSCAKLAQRYCGPFQILDRVGLVAYRIALSTNMRVHNVFHGSLLKKYVHDHNHVFDWNVIQVKPRESSSGDYMYPPLERDHALKPSHRSSKSEKETPGTR